MTVALTEEEQVLATQLRRQAQTGTLHDPHRARITFAELSKAVDPDRTWRYPMTTPPFRGLQVALVHISMFERERGRPLLGVLVVDAESQEPVMASGDLASLGCNGSGPTLWEDELRTVVRFWTSEDVLLSALDAATDRILGELANLKRLARTSETVLPALAKQAKQRAVAHKV